MGYLLTCRLRRLMQDPDQILAPYVRPGMTVLEPGPGMGFFTLALARLTGPSGRVIAVDIQARMLAALQRRAAKAGLQDRIEARLAAPGSLQLGSLAGSVDFTLAFAVVHEMPDAATLFAEIAGASKAGASVLFAEPARHVPAAAFEGEVEAAVHAGFAVTGRPAIRRSRTALLQKGGLSAAPGR
jgi:ubiquinone/menaquinone biosynthesis C-methylase UbiE